jgi:dihydrofolate reductase
MDRGRVIGAEGKLPWHIPEDLQRFKALTTGHTIIMGRKTFESIGRPLPKRTNIVVTRDSQWQAEGVAVAPSIEAALQKALGDEAFIIGGGEIYEQTVDQADRLYLTLVDGAYEGDAFFPDFDAAAFTEVSREQYDGPPPYAFVTYDRNK